MAEALQTHYGIDIAGIWRSLPLLEVKPSVRIAVLNILGDTELVQAAAKALAEKLRPKDCEVLLTAEAKSIPLTHALSVAMEKPYVVLRKAYKPYMGDALSARTLSITTGKAQTLYLDAKDNALLKRARTAIIDDVISTGSTLEGMRTVAQRAGAIIAAEAAILTEGDAAQWGDIVSLGHLPLFIDQTESA
jgi:adenine phosphoribosyltransferase